MNDKTNWQEGADGWSVDLSQGTALHESGFRLEFSGHPSSRNFDVQPSGLGGEIGAVQWAMLLRQGTDEYRRAYAREGSPGGGEEVDADDEMQAAPRQPRKPVITVKRKRQIV